MRPVIFMISILAVLTFSTVVQAQKDREGDIQDRLDEIQEMINEEQSTIGKLEKQLKDAVNGKKDEQAARIREEIDTAFDRVDRLKELNKKLRDLMDVAEEAGGRGVPKAIPRNPRDRKVPNPQIGGVDNKGDLDEAIKKYRARKARERANEQAPIPNAGGNVADRGERERRPRNDVREEPNRLRSLRDALRALEEAGEFDLARQVERLIRREESRAGNDEKSDDDNGRDGDRGRGVRGAGGGGVMADDDTPPPRKRIRRSTKAGDQQRSRGAADDELDDVISDLRDEIERLRGEVRDMKDKDSRDRR